MAQRTERLHICSRSSSSSSSAALRVSRLPHQQEPAVARCRRRGRSSSTRPAGADRSLLRLAAGAHPERPPGPALGRAGLQRRVGQQQLLPVRPRVLVLILPLRVAPRGHPAARLDRRRRLPRPRHRRRLRLPRLEPLLLRALLPGRRHRSPCLLGLRRGTAARAELQGGRSAPEKLPKVAGAGFLLQQHWRQHRRQQWSRRRGHHGRCSEQQDQVRRCSRTHHLVANELSWLYRLNSIT